MSPPPAREAVIPKSGQQLLTVWLRYKLKTDRERLEKGAKDKAETTVKFTEFKVYKYILFMTLLCTCFLVLNLNMFLAKSNLRWIPLTLPAVKPFHFDLF